MLGAQHAFDVFPSFRTAAVIEGVERFLTSVHSAYLAGRTDAAVGDTEVAAPLVDSNSNAGHVNVRKPRCHDGSRELKLA